MQLALSTFGRLDILINNAGAGNYKNLVDTSVEEYDHLMDANMKSSFLFSRHATPPMIAQKSGIQLFISSIAGLQGYAGEAVYCASKFAQVGFAQALDAELRPHNINVGTICPGGTKTEFALGKGRTEEYIRNSHMMEPRRRRPSHRLRLHAAPQHPHLPDDRPPHGLEQSSTLTCSCGCRCFLLLSFSCHPSRSGGSAFVLPLPSSLLLPLPLLLLLG